MRSLRLAFCILAAALVTAIPAAALGPNVVLRRCNWPHHSNIVEATKHVGCATALRVATDVSNPFQTRRWPRRYGVWTCSRARAGSFPLLYECDLDHGDKNGPSYGAVWVSQVGE